MKKFRALLIILLFIQFPICDVLVRQKSQAFGQETLSKERMSATSGTASKTKSKIRQQKSQTGPGKEIKDEGRSGKKEGEGSKEYSVYDTVKETKQKMKEEKKQLEFNEGTPEEQAKKVEAVEEEAMKDLYEQKIVQEAVSSPSITPLERTLQREKFRRAVMARAGKEIRPAFKLRKGFSMRISETYDDNVYLTRSDTREDYITKISPSALFSVNSKAIAFDVNYIIDYTRYRNRPDLSGTSHLLLTYMRPGALALPFFHKRGGKIGIEIQDDFQPMVTSVASSEQTQRTERTSNRLSLALDYYMSEKRTLSLEYKNLYEKYKTTSLKPYSYSDSSISPVFYFHVRPKWSLFGGYSFGTITYLTQTESSNDSTYQQLKGGISGRLFAKVTTHFEIGEEFRSYKKAKNAVAQDVGNVRRLFWRTAFLDNFTPQATGSLEFNHSVEESTYANNPYFMSDVISVNLNYMFSYKTTILFGLVYTRNSYDRETTEEGMVDKREDQIWSPRLGLRYYIKRWCSTDLDYAYSKRISNFKNVEYVDNKILGGVNFSF